MGIIGFDEFEELEYLNYVVELENKERLQNQINKHLSIGKKTYFDRILDMLDGRNNED